MVRSFRKRHRFIWLAIAVLMPLLFINAYRSSESRVLPKNAALDFGTIVIRETVQSEDKNFDYVIKREGASNHLLLDLKIPYPSPSVAVYIGPAGRSFDDQFIILGQLSSVKSYRFELGESIQHRQLLIYDAIKDKTFVSINLN